jgi:hypothetical protein
LDACFKQKSRKAQGKEAPAPWKHPDTAFVSSEDVKAMEDVVNEIRPEPKSGLKGKKSLDGPLQPQKDENPDLCEPGLKVPNSVLNSVRKFSSVRFFAPKTGNRGPQPV